MYPPSAGPPASCDSRTDVQEKYPFLDHNKTKFITPKTTTVYVVRHKKNETVPVSLSI